MDARWPYRWLVRVKSLLARKRRWSEHRTALFSEQQTVRIKGPPKCISLENSRPTLAFTPSAEIAMLSSFACAQVVVQLLIESVLECIWAAICRLVYWDHKPVVAIRATTVNFTQTSKSRCTQVVVVWGSVKQFRISSFTDSHIDPTRP